MAVKAQTCVYAVSTNCIQMGEDVRLAGNDVWKGLGQVGGKKWI